MFIPDGSERHLPRKLSISGDLSADDVANTNLNNQLIIYTKVINSLIMTCSDRGAAGKSLAATAARPRLRRVRSFMPCVM